MSTYFFPIKSSSLAHYFGGACIKAAKYFDNKPQDIQDRYKDFLLLTSKTGTKDTDCCLELVLTKDEIKDLIDVKNGWYLLDTNPLPITRIKKIYFSDKEQKDATITNIRMSTAYVPEFLLEVIAFDENPSSSLQLPPDCHGIDQTDKIKQYDRFLGALALMRLAHEPYMNYSINYISTLSFFNKIIDKQLKTNEQMNFNDAFQGIFTKNKGFEKVLQYLDHSIDEESLNSVARANNQTIKKDKITRIIDIDSLTDTWTYTIAILNAYGVGEEARKKRVDGLIQSNFSTLKEGKQEGVALCYGYNRGYSAFTKSYGEVVFKYKLESQLDYYTIESVYQYVFNGTVSSDFPYLDDWCPKLHPEQPKHSNQYVVLDELIIGKKKPLVLSKEWWDGLYSKFKIFGVLADKIFEVVKTVVEKDICLDITEQVQEDFECTIENETKKQVSLQKELDEVKKERCRLENENRHLENELKKANLPIQYQNNALHQTQNVVSEPESEYNVAKDSSEEKLKIVVLKYEDYTLKELKKIAKLKDDATLSELLLHQPNDKDLFSTK